jgi:two-component system, NarL family, sensor histidine kinase DesK
MRILPRELERDLGFTPYAWLVYVVPFVADPIWRGRPWPEILFTLLGLAAFLLLYFAGYWRQGTGVLPVLAGLTALGVAFAPLNGGSLCFYIYAAGHAARSGPPRTALYAIAVIIAAAGGATLGFGAPGGHFVVAAVFSVIVGGVNIHFGEVDRKNTLLRASQEEVARLARTAERERIARDLHDLLGHTLSVIVLKSELATKLAPRDTEAAIREIRDVEAISRQALSEVRAAVAGFRSSVPAEISRAETALAAAGIAFVPEVEALALPPGPENVLALAIREAVTNVVRHAGAHSCRLRLERQAGDARLLIEDDGRGGLAAEGSGLSSMRERLHALGGTLERSGENGTRLVIQIPLVS